MEFNIPDQKTVRLSDAEKFVECIKLAANQCGLSAVNYNGFGPTEFTFNDGSILPGLRMWFDSGIISESKWRDTYSKLFDK